MNVKPTMLLVFLVGLGCAGPTPPAPATAGFSRVSARPSPAPAVTAAVSGPSLAEADRAYEAQLGLARGGQFDVERQIAELRRAVLLYTQFLERAEGRPELLPAMRRARERLADAEETIAFLEPRPRAP